MARYGIWRPLASNWSAQLRIQKHDLIILHTMVGSLWGTDAYFRQNGYGGNEAHFGVGHDGELLQWQDTDWQTDANGAANRRAISIETADIGQGFPRWNTRDGNAVPAWTSAQVDKLIDLIVWICQTHNIPCVGVLDSKPERRGVAYHRLGVPGYVVPGGELWSSARGKSCPGPARIKQIPNIIARAANILDSSQQALTKEQISRLQYVLNAWYRLQKPDWYPLAVDGILGPKTTVAIKYFQHWAGLPETGIADARTLRTLNV